MDTSKRSRGLKRATVTKMLIAVEEEMMKKPMDLEALQVSMKVLEGHMSKLEELDDRIREAMLKDDNVTNEEIETEDDVCRSYIMRYEKAKHKVNSILFPLPIPRSPARSEVGSAGSVDTPNRSKRNFKLPKIELREFSGDLREWLGWWAQFEKIHADEELHATDKFTYLVQSMKKGSRAADLITSYPQSSENYPKAVDALKQRYGNPKILKQVYVRELISMIIMNRGGDKGSLSSMHDKLVAHLRSLESLGVTVQQAVVFLFPMVESSLPEDVLLAWQRSPNFGKDGTDDTPPKSELDYLMDFLKQEIENEEQRKLARTGFVTDKKRTQRKIIEDQESVPTAAGLFNGSFEKRLCLFCGKGNHATKSCFKAPKMAVQERRQKVKRGGGCFSCLKPGHVSKQCRSFEKCSSCGKDHSVLLCQEVKTSSDPVQKKEEPQTVQSNLNLSSPVILRTLIVWIKNGKAGMKKKVRVLLDCGSQRSYVLQRTAEELGLIPEEEITVNHQLFGGGEILNLKHQLYNVLLSSTRSHFKTTIQVMDQEALCGLIPRVRDCRIVKELEENGIFLSDVDPSNPSEVELLIGADILGQILTGRIQRLDHGLVATETKLGWCLMGPLPKVYETVRDDVNNLAVSVTSMYVSCASVPELWKLDTIGISDPAETQSKEEREASAMEHFLKTVDRKEDGRYSVSLPWLNLNVDFPSNRDVAFRRLESTTKKLDSMGMYTAYDSIFKVWEAEGIISRIEEASIQEGSVHYLPHRAVLKPESLTTPVRPVFDASCKMGRSPSLNDMLEKGPNLLEQIPSVLLRFRVGLIGLISDICKAFLMILINESDRSFMRFLWWDKEKNELVVYRHNRVVFGVNCSPFLLGAVINFHLRQHEESYPKAVSLLKMSLYVDNCVGSVDSDREFDEFKSQATAIMAEAKMDLRMWERSYEPGENGVTGVLGLRWDKVTDELMVTSIPVEIPTKITKKVILSQLHQVFDPLGFLSPVLITAKILLQKAWLEDRKWEEEVSDELKQQFVNWCNGLLPVLDLFRVPRNCTGGNGWVDANRQLHIFSDASRQAYAAVVYLRVETEEGVCVQLLQSKARVAPAKSTKTAKPVTIPRLELLGCSIGARLATSVKKALGFEAVPTTYWSDSSTALSWIQSSDEWGTFVGNRVREILSLTKQENWKHVPGVLNPADLPSRGIDPKKFINSKWWEGPKWLKLDSSEWPSSEVVPDEEEVNSERKCKVTVLLNNTEMTPSWYVVRNSYISNLRILALVFRFVDKSRKVSTESKKSPTVKELNLAERRLFKLVQDEALKEIDGKVGDLNVIRDSEGVIRVKTKIIHRQDSEDFTAPLLLPHQHPLTTMYIRDVHVFGCHRGIQATLGALREKVWVIRGRSAVKRVLRSCVTCQRFTCRRVEVPTPALPEHRVKDAHAFEITGIDLAGPLFLKDKSKVWIVLFTCAVYRGVHLEIVQSISTEDFLLAFTRFCMRRTRPAVVYTDNGTNFTGTKNLIEDVDWKYVEKKTSQHRIEWRLNPPSAPWWGGWWERLIRSVKDLLKRMLGFGKLGYVELETCLCEVEYVMNHRPLTFITEDQEDLVPLTPAMFHYDLPVSDLLETQLINIEMLGQRRKNLAKLFEEIKGRFRKEYLGLLVQRGKAFKAVDLKVGDFVLIGREDRKRLLWPMGRIEELMPGKDGIERVAKVKTKNGCLLRPVQRLFPLEFSKEDSVFSGLRENKLKKINVKNGAIRRQTVEEARTENENTSVEEKSTKKGRVIRKPMRYCDY